MNSVRLKTSVLRRSIAGLERFSRDHDAFAMRRKSLKLEIAALRLHQRED